MAAARKKKKRRSQAPVALVYFVTVLVFMGLLAALSVYLLKEFNIIDDGSSEDNAVVSNPVFTNLYARVNSKGQLQDATIVRIDPDKQKILVIPIPAVTTGSIDKSMTLRDVLADGGMTKLKEEVEDLFGVTVDNYMSVTNDAFERVADIFDGIIYTPKEELYYLSKDNDSNDISISKGELANLSGRQIRLICQYPVFSNGMQGNTDFLGEAVSGMINHAFQQSAVIMDNLDNIYDILTANSDTDLTSDDFKLQKSYLKEMLTSGSTPAEYICPEGTWWDSDEAFELSSEFKAELRDGTAEETTAEDSAE
ncbi:MAG: LCP family protein [Ruminococcus sp.]|nr:LCP family protein [Ruminococcus sp.]